MDTTRRTQLALGAIWLLALALNLTCAVLRPGGSPDTERYDRIGWNLALGNGYSASLQPPHQPDVFRAPGYPAFLAAAYRVVGHDLRAVRLLQAFLLSFIVPLTYFVARAAFDRPTALLSALLAALYPYFWVYSAAVLSDGLAALLTAGAMALLVLSLEGRAGWALIAGIGLGILSLFKPAMLLFPIVAAAIYAVRDRWSPPVVVVTAGVLRGRGVWMARAVACLAGAMLIVCPWTARNYRVTGRLLPVASGGGLMLYAGAVAGATDYDLNEFHQRVELGDWRIQAEQHETDPFRVLALDDQMKADGLRLIAAHPLGYVRHTVTAAFRVWISAWVWRDGRWALSWPHALLSGGLLVGALAGLIVQRRRWREVLIPLTLVLYISLAHAPFTTEARQSLPGRIGLMMFASALVVDGLRRLRRRTRPLPEPGDETAQEPPERPTSPMGASTRSCYTACDMPLPSAARRHAVGALAREGARGT
ncbi:glycosyltransferase family 39 protein [bacterium]|nr:glycosyltransferase family 39 protein [bacterium]